MTGIKTPARILGAVIAILGLCVTSGCIYSQIKAESGRPIRTGMDVIVRSAIEQHLMHTVGLFPPDMPPEAAAVPGRVMAAYEAQLVQKRPFREVRQIARPVKSDAEALWYARSEGCDLVMVPVITYAMDGTGAMPTRITIRSRILDARTGMVLWDVKQNAFSEPGADVDLFWNTVSGQPAQRLSELVEVLARQFTDFLVQPLEKEKKDPQLLPPNPVIQ